jgi:hypothetical protein
MGLVLYVSLQQWRVSVVNNTRASEAISTDRQCRSSAARHALNWKMHYIRMSLYHRVVLQQHATWMPKRTRKKCAAELRKNACHLKADAISCTSPPHLSKIQRALPCTSSVPQVPLHAFDQVITGHRRNTNIPHVLYGMCVMYRGCMAKLKCSAYICDFNGLARNFGMQKLQLFLSDKKIHMRQRKYAIVSHAQQLYHN